MPVRDFLRRTLKKGKVSLSRLQLKLQPNRPQSNRQLAQALVDRGDWDAAIDQCHRTLRFTPDDPWTYKALAEAHNGKGEFAAALDAIHQALTLDAHQGYFHYTLARIHINQSHWSEAIAAGKHALELDDSVSWFHYQFGETLVKSGNWQAAIAPLERAIQLHPLFAWSYFYLAEAYLALEQPQNAIDLYRRALKFNPDIDYIRQSLYYAEHLQIQEQRIQDFVQAAQAEDRQAADSKFPEQGDRLQRVLLVAPYPTYPPKLGGITRMFYEMKTLGSCFTLTVACFIFNKEDYRLETDLARYCQLPITVMNGDSPPQPAGLPNLIHRYSSLRMRKLLQMLSAANFDIVVFDMIYMAQYRDLFPNAYHVLSEQNIESQLLRSCSEVANQTQLNQMMQQQSSVKAFVGGQTEADLLANYENEQWQHFPLRWVVSDLDQAELDRRCPTGKTVVVRNGVDTKDVQVQEDNPNNRILFIGTLSYYPNIDGATYFTETILPLIWQQDPSVEFWIAGSAPPQSILDWGQHPQIRVIANPDDMTEVARQCSVTVVPLRIGSGTRIKILQAFGMGLPVITTSLGCAGLEVRDRTHLSIQDEPAAFAQATLELLRDRQLRQTFRQNGRNLVEREYDWDCIYQTAVNQLATEFQAWATPDHP
ncbi:MAG: glycosyltransferase [Synechococcales bacterium]|nr:glycosyltransferase [Synechococcales bacterium]